MHSKQLCTIIPGKAKADARRVFLALDAHFRNISRSPDSCPYCIPYARYGVLHMTGDYVQHITNLVNDGKEHLVHDVPTQIEILTSKISDKERLLTIDEIAPRKYCITFVVIQEQLLRKVG